MRGRDTTHRYSSPATTYCTEIETKGEQMREEINEGGKKEKRTIEADEKDSGQGRAVVRGR